MRMNAGFILGGQQPDIVNTLARADAARAAKQNQEYQVDYRNALQTHGAGAAQGNQNAINALAGYSQFGPQGAMGLETGRLNQQATRQRMAALSAQEARAVEAHAASLSAAERQAQAQRIEQGVAMGLAAQTPEQWDQVVGQMAPELVGQFENREMLANRYRSIADIMKGMAPPEPDYQQIGDGQFVDMNAPMSGAQDIPGVRTEQKVPLVDFSGANIGGQAPAVDGVAAGQDPNSTATPRDPGKLASSLSSNDAAYLQSERDRARSAEELQGLSERLRLLGSPDRIGYTGPGGNAYHFFDQMLGDSLPGDAGARAAFKSGGVEAQLTFTERTKGAITEREMALFQAASPNLTNRPEGNALIADILAAGAKRSQTRYNFLEAYARKRGSLEGAEQAWDDYMNANPILAENPDGSLRINSEGDWQAALEAPQAMDFAPAQILQMDRSGLENLPIEQMTEQQLFAVQERLNQLGGQ